jgi:hypothetical protein
MELSRKRAIAGAARRSPKPAILLNKSLNALMDGVRRPQSELIVIGMAERQTGHRGARDRQSFCAVRSAFRRWPADFRMARGRYQVRVNCTEAQRS